MKTLKTFLGIMGIAILIDAFLLEGVASMAGQGFMIIIGVSMLINKTKDTWIVYTLFALNVLSIYGGMSAAGLI